MEIKLLNSKTLHNKVNIKFAIKPVDIAGARVQVQMAVKPLMITCNFFKHAIQPTHTIQHPALLLKWR